MDFSTFAGKLLNKAWRGVERVLIVLYLPLGLLLYCARVRFLDGNLYYRIGHLALEPDCFIKAELLGWHAKYRGVLLCPKNRMLNPALFECWQSHFTVIGNTLLYYILYPLSINPLLRVYFGSITPVGKGKTARVFPAVYTIAREYDETFGFRPLVKLPAARVEDGWRRLRGLGIPQGAWFACLHVREPGYLPDLNYHSYRDADISSYIPATEAIAERGGWVVRIGDPTMRPLEGMDHIIDLTPSDPAQDGMDIFCLSQCKFAIGTTSGPIAVSYVFGVPTALTNWVPMGHGGFCSRDTWIPKLYWSEAEKRHLTFAEVLSTPKRSYGQTVQYETDGISVVDNSAEEIRDVCIEVMDKVDDRFEYDEEDLSRQEQFQSLLALQSAEWTTEARVGRDFLRKHHILFDGGF